MKKVPVLAIALPLSAVAMFALFCLTASYFDSGSLELDLSTPFLNFGAKVEKSEK